MKVLKAGICSCGYSLLNSGIKLSIHE
jgi:hypothetical protein